MAPSPLLQAQQPAILYLFPASRPTRPLPKLQRQTRWQLLCLSRTTNEPLSPKWTRPQPLQLMQAPSPLARTAAPIADKVPTSTRLSRPRPWPR